MDALVTAGLTRRFGSRTAVGDLSLSVKEGDVYGFLGPNGAGKTTAIRCILGLIRPDSGEVSIFGERDSVRQRAFVGAMVETPAFHRWMTAEDNLARAAAFSGIGREGIDAALERVGLAGRGRDRVGGYSLGMRQRLGIARALLSKPRLLILDEPTNGLDPRGMKEVRDLLAALARDEGITIFISSHLLAEVEQLCTRIGILEHGRLIAEGTPSELAGRQQVAEVGAEDREALKAALAAMSIPVLSEGEQGRLRVSLASLSAADLNRGLIDAGVAVNALIPGGRSLEDLFLSLTSEELS
jgi:ABC-type multidrug transport system ATPase subunit